MFIKTLAKLLPLLQLFFFDLQYFANATDENDQCRQPYYVVNTYKDAGGVNVTCFSKSSSCIIYFSPKGVGCETLSNLKSVGEIPPAQTKELEFESPLGSGICSESEISAYINTGTFDFVQLPAPPSAGKNFHMVFNFVDTPRDYQCVMAALNLDAAVTYVLGSENDNEVSVGIQANDISVFEFSVVENGFVYFRAVSTNLIIVSCREKNLKLDAIFVLESMSAEPVLVVLNQFDYLTVVWASCSTNNILTREILSDIRLSTFGSTDCNTIVSEKLDRSLQVLDFCAALVTPVREDDCVSLLAVRNTGFIRFSGLPESKFTTELVEDPRVGSLVAYAFSDTICEVYSDETIAQLQLKWMPASLDQKVASIIIPIDLEHIISMTCNDPVYLEFYGRKVEQFRAGRWVQSAWQEYFDTGSCKTVPSPGPNPEPSPNLGPNPSAVPTSEPSKAISSSLLAFSVGLCLAFY